MPPMFLNDDVLEIACSFLGGLHHAADVAPAAAPPPLWVLLGVNRQCRRCALHHGLSALGARRLAARCAVMRAADAEAADGVRRADGAILSLVAPGGLAGEHPATVAVLSPAARRLHRQFGCCWEPARRADGMVGGTRALLHDERLHVGRWLAFCMRCAEVLAVALGGTLRVQVHCPAACLAPPWNVAPVLQRALAATVVTSPGIVLDALCSPTTSTLGYLGGQQLARLFDGTASHAAAVAPRTLCFSADERAGLVRDNLKEFDCLKGLGHPRSLTALDLTHVAGPLAAFAEALGRFPNVSVLRLLHFKDFPTESDDARRSREESARHGLGQLARSGRPSVFGPALRELDLSLAQVSFSDTLCLYKHLHETLEELSLQSVQHNPAGAEGEWTDLLAWPEYPMKRLRRLDLGGNMYVWDGGLMAMLGPRCQACGARFVELPLSAWADVERTCRSLIGVDGEDDVLMCPACRRTVDAPGLRTLPPTSLYPALEELGVALCELYTVDALIAWVALSARRGWHQPAHVRGETALKLACGAAAFADEDDEMPRLTGAVAACNGVLTRAQPPPRRPHTSAPIVAAVVVTLAVSDDLVPLALL